MKRGLLIALAHAALLMVLAAYGRNMPHTGQSVWVRAHLSLSQPGGRYIRLDVEVQRVGFPPSRPMDPCRAEIQNGILTCVHDPIDGRQYTQWGVRPESRPSRLRARNLIYLPQGVNKPAGTDELWAEVAIAQEQVPHVVRLGVKRAGVLQPLW